MANIEDLVTAFHSLEGNLVSEKKKNFKSLLSSVEATLKSEEEVSAFVAALTPRNRPEEIFKVDVLIHLRRNGELLEVLKSGKPVLIKKVLNYWRFFQDNFENVDAHAVVNELFPYTSYCTRVKIINRLSKKLISERQADDYFRAIEERYGLKTATIILPGCSLELIQSVVTQNKVKLRQRHLELIVKRHPDSIQFYWEHLKCTRRYELFNHRVMEYIAKTDPQLFWQLPGKHVRFGKRMTSRMLRTKNDIDVHFSGYQSMFKTTQMLKMLAKNKEVFRKFCLDRFPSDIERFDFDVYTTTPLRESLKRVKDDRRYDVINSYFREKYNHELHDFPRKITLELLKIMPADLRDIVLDEKVKSDEDLVYLYTTRKSIPILKQRINHTSDITAREKLIQFLVRTCIFNKNEGALLYVLRYVSRRHKNDLPIMLCVMKTLRQWKNLQDLGTEHWDLINDFLKFIEISDKNYTADLIFTEKHILFLARNRLAYDEQLKDLLLRLKKESYNFLALDDQKFFLKKFGPLIPEHFQGDEYNNVSINFLKAIIHYNEHFENEEIPITDCPEMLNAAKSLIGSRHEAVDIITYCVQTQEEFYSFFWENLEHFQTDYLIAWYIKTKPLQVLQKIEAILKQCSLRVHVQLMKKIQFTGELVRFYLDALHNEKYKDRDFTIPVLSRLLTHEEYFEAVKHLYPPSDGKIDVNSSSQEQVALQKQAVENLKNLTEPSRCLPVLLKFCIADYLKYALSPLYGLVTNTPEMNLPSFFETLYNSAVSVRKHVVTLTSIVSTKETIYNFLKVTGQTDKNSSLQKVILKKTLKYFKENPSEVLWNLFQENVKVIDENDREAHDALLELGAIPEENLPQYIVLVYEKLASNPDKEIEKTKLHLLGSVPNDVIHRLDETFLKQTIDDTFLVPSYRAGLTHFCLSCIFCNEGQTRENLYEYVINIWKNYVEKDWFGLAKGEARTQVYEFVKTFCSRLVSSKANESFVKKFANDFKSMFNLEDAIDEHLHVDFTVLYLTCNSAREFGGKLNVYFHQLVQKYDAGIIDVFSNVMEHYVCNCANIRSNDEIYLNFMEGFFYENQSTNAYLTLLEMLCREGVSSHRKHDYKSMYDIIKQCDVPIIQVRLKRYLRQNCEKAIYWTDNLDIFS